MAALPAAIPAIELSLASRGISQGLAQTDGPQLFARASVRVGPAQGGVQWKNIDSRSANGVAAMFVRFRQDVAGTQVELGAAYRIRSGASANVEAWEFSAALQRTIGRLSLRAYSEYSPNEFGSGTSIWAEAGPRFDVDTTTQISANVGIRKRTRGEDYVAFNGGITKLIVKGVSFDARYYGTDRPQLGTPFRGRFIVALRLVASKTRR